MPTSIEVEQLLTGPGGAFEVTTDTVRGVEMKVYKDRMRSLRDIFPMAAMRGDGDGATHIVYGDRRIGFGEFTEGANRVSSALAARHGIGRGDRVAVLSANNPEWVYTFWGTVNLGAILVGLNGWWKADEIVYGLEDSGARVLVADRGRYERIADQVDSLGLDAVYIVEDNFGELLDEPRSEPRLPDGADRGGRPRGHLLHERHHGQAEGRHLDAPLDDRQPPEHDVQRGRRRHARAAAGDALGGQRRADREPADVADVPRVGLSLGHGRRPARRHQARHPGRQVRAREGDAAHRRTRRSRCGRRCPRWCGGSSSTPTVTTTTCRRSRRSPTAGRRRPPSCSAGCRRRSAR